MGSQSRELSPMSPPTPSSCASPPPKGGALERLTNQKLETSRPPSSALAPTTRLLDLALVATIIDAVGLLEALVVVNVLLLRQLTTLHGVGTYPPPSMIGYMYPGGGITIDIIIPR